jgi:hypothetical protein
LLFPANSFNNRNLYTFEVRYYAAKTFEVKRVDIFVGVYGRGNGGMCVEEVCGVFGGIGCERCMGVCLGVCVGVYTAVCMGMMVFVCGVGGGRGCVLYVH